MGFNIYIRDVSFLGFPSYRIYIPGMSEINNIFSNRHFKQTYNRKGSLHSFYIAHNLYQATDEDVKVLLDCIDELPETLDTTVISSFNKKDPWSNTNLYFLAALICFRHDDLSRAINYIKKTIKINTHNNTQPLYRCCEDMMQVGENNNVYKIIESIYGNQIFKLAYNLMYSSKWLDYFKFTHCFNCMDCKIQEYCSLIPYARLLKNIEEVYELNIPNQGSLEKIFC